MDFLRQDGAGGGLGKGIAAGKGKAVQEGIIPDSVQNLPHRNTVAAGKGLQLGIMAAGAAEIAALDKYRIAETRAVYDGLRLQAAYDETSGPWVVCCPDGSLV
jgi:hypothetical protein